MSEIPFWKLESVGNDFPVIRISDLGSQIPLVEFAISICDRRFGIGGDGLLAFEKKSDQVLFLRMFNPDGTEDFCGNGIRCVAHLARLKAWMPSDFEVLHLGQHVPIQTEGLSIRSEIGSASYDPEDVPLRKGLGEIFESEVAERLIDLKGSALSTGSTHVILPVAQLPDDEEFHRIGPLVETSEYYPHRTSVIWRERMSNDRIKIRIWERGVGETFGCGTGASAAVADLFRSENRGGTVQVESPGGTLSVSAKRWDAPITVVGSAKLVFEGAYPIAETRSSSTSLPSTS